ncbi:MAG: MBL fold metallo-hydrolase [Defluviitaleaceae bacterium]|nr:MBL fold metallo-hydrolase [Defluviitaleaceae bacterium]
MQLSKNIRRLVSTKGSAAYLLATSGGHTLIDTGSPTASRGIMNELSSLQIHSLSKILLTHHDPDHIGNISVLQQTYNCPVYIHSRDIPYIQGTKRRTTTKAIFSYLLQINTCATLTPLENQSFEDIQIIHTPGHTPGHTCFLFEDFLFTGDFFRLPWLRLLPYHKRTGWKTAEIAEQLCNSIKLPFKWVCPAHFMPQRF